MGPFELVLPGFDHLVPGNRTTRRLAPAVLGYPVRILPGRLIWRLRRDGFPGGFDDRDWRGLDTWPAGKGLRKVGGQAGVDHKTTHN